MINVDSNQELDSSDPLKPNTKTVLDSFRFFKGRRYHNLADVTYLFPNDDKEADRLNLQYHIFKFVWKNNFSSPVHELLKSGNAKVLDVGCGTGQCLLDMAKNYPEATFVGLDMSPMFPDVKDTPPNVMFLQLNLNDGIPFPDGTFDFVFQRFLCNNVLFESWKFYVEEMIRVTKNGGWVEFFEFITNYQTEDPFITRVVELVFAGFRAKGINPEPETCVPQLLEKCQELSKIHYEELSVPVGDRAEQLNSMMETYLLMNIETVRLLVTSALGIDDETYDLINDNAGKDHDKSKACIKSFRWFSQKI